MSHKFFEDRRPHNAKTYAEFEAATNKYLNETNPETLEGKEKIYYDYKKLNKARSSRIMKTFKASDEIVEIMHNLNEPQLWMVITEDWCGDSAQNLPYLVKLSELNENINLRIIERDANPDIMNLYLTNGTSRSIPKLVAFDESGNELFQWGPRPEAAVQKISEWKEEGLSKEEWTPKLHAWYAQNKGEAIISEITALLDKFVNIGV